MNPIIRIFAFFSSVLTASIASAADYPAPTEGDFTIRDFKFQSGETLPELRLHYRTLGKPEKDAQGKTYAMPFSSCTEPPAAARNLFARNLPANFLATDQPLDATKFFIVLPDGIGHGKSSKPSDGMHAKFPRYGYLDMVEAQYRLLTEGLGVNHARLVMGTSMGGMHTWLWGELHPDFMDALMPLASLPTQISGRNRAWRRMVIDAIRNDPAWNGGEYPEAAAAQPAHRCRDAVVHEQQSGPASEGRAYACENRRSSGQVRRQIVKTDDANDVLYALEASHDYDPGPGLEKIRAPLRRDQFCRRSDQSAGARNSRARDQARAARARHCDSNERQNTRSRQPHTCRVMERSVGGAAQGNGKIISISLATESLSFCLANVYVGNWRSKSLWLPIHIQTQTLPSNRWATAR